MTPFNSTNTAFTSSYLHQPFSHPTASSLKKLYSIASSRVGWYEDHLLSLQADPGYLLDYVQLLTSTGTCESTAAGFIQIARELSGDLRTLWNWRWVLEEIDNIRMAHASVRNDIKPGQPLPAPLTRAIAALSALLSTLTQQLVLHLSMVKNLRPGFRKYFNQLRTKDFGVLLVRSPHFNEQAQFNRDRLDFILN
jgi:hypothetical protein